MLDVWARSTEGSRSLDLPASGTLARSESLMHKSLETRLLVRVKALAYLFTFLAFCSYYSGKLELRTTCRIKSICTMVC